MPPETHRLLCTVCTVQCSGSIVWYGLYQIQQGQTVHRANIIDKLDKQNNILKMRLANLHTEKRADRKIIRLFAFKYFPLFFILNYDFYKI